MLHSQEIKLLLPIYVFGKHYFPPKILNPLWADFSCPSCSEEDVEGEHSTSSGKIGDKELFYIMSRGFKLKEARKLLVRAKFNSIIEKIKKTELKEEIVNEIDKRLD